MKIYSKIVIDMDTLQTIEEESYEYIGEVAQCKSGGAGGGSPSGVVAYPAYMESAHNEWLNRNGNDHVLYSVVQAMNMAMQGDSPYHGFTTIKVDDVFLGRNVPVTDYLSPFARLQNFSCFNLESKYNEYKIDDEAKIANAVAAEMALLDNTINENVLPAFQAAMDDIGAVQTSSFIIGEAIIWDGRNKAIAKTDADIRLDRLTSGGQLALQRISLFVEWSRLITTMSAELARLYVAGRHDVDGMMAEMSAKDRLFDLGIYQFGVNVMSSISGSAVSPPDPGVGKSLMGGAISGALAGAAAGSMISPGMGTVIGGAVGLAAGLMQ